MKNGKRKPTNFWKGAEGKANRKLGVSFRDCWQTPDWILEAVRSAFGPIDLDPCTVEANPTKARRCFTALRPCPYPHEMPGASQGVKLVFQNHPYSDNNKWARIAVDYAALNPKVHYVVLANASVGTQWARLLNRRCKAFAEPFKRVKFVEPTTGKEHAGNNWGSRLWYFGPDPVRFAAAFAATCDVGTLNAPSSTGGEGFVKTDHSKTRLELLPPEAIVAMGRAFTYGAEKYAPDNWRKCDEPGRYAGALLRHVCAKLAGVHTDPESGLNQHDHILACAAMWCGVDLAKREITP